MSIKILLADDSITIQKVVGIIFGGEEYSLTVVDNGKAAVEKAREISPDVLLIDALMPGMSGYEVCEAVRATPAISTKPILLLTGSFEPFDEDKAKSCGADDFLAKPFESQQIVTKVKELFELGSSRSAAPSAVTEEVHEPETFLPPPVPEVVEEPAAANDIWGAFTSEPATETPATTADQSEDFDIAAMVEDPGAQTVQMDEENIGSQWVPTEEETFEFEEEVPAGAPETGFIVPETAAEENTYGDTDFEVADSEPLVSEAEAEAEVETAPVTEPAPTVELPLAPLVEPSAVTPPIALTEEQLREALAVASKDVIERIVWEVVPDLAEVLIKEAIRKIKEGQ